MRPSPESGSTPIHPMVRPPRSTLRPRAIANWKRSPSLFKKSRWRTRRPRRWRVTIGVTEGWSAGMTAKNEPAAAAEERTQRFRFRVVAPDGRELVSDVVAVRFPLSPQPDPASQAGAAKAAEAPPA